MGYLTEVQKMIENGKIAEAMTVKLDGPLPPPCSFEHGIRRAPDRGLTLGRAETELALKNALRYVPEEWHEVLAPEFMEELLTRGRIYGYRFRPQERIWGRPIDDYKGKTVEGRAFQVMIDNNWTSTWPCTPTSSSPTGKPARFARTGCSIGSS